MSPSTYHLSTEKPKKPFKLRLKTRTYSVAHSDVHGDYGFVWICGWECSKKDCWVVMFGLKIIENPLIPGRWVFPKDRFIEYGSEDEWWGRLLGVGHEVFDTCFRVGDMIVVHPIMAKEIRKKFEEYNNPIIPWLSF